MIAGLILAAGEGTRFGSSPKLLAELESRPLLEHAIEAQCAVPELERIVVVLGARAEALLRAVDFMRAEPRVCDRWREGRVASLRCGLAHLRGAEKVLVTLGDQPLITPETICRFLSEPRGSRAVYEGRPGHPVLLGPVEVGALSAVTGGRGARDLLHGREIELGALGDVDQDVDTKADQERIRRRCRIGAAER